MPFTAELKRPSNRPSHRQSVSTLPARASGIAPRRPGRSDDDDRPTDPAPAVHCFLVPKFPRDPRLPNLAELSQQAHEYVDAREAALASERSTFRPAPILRHLYRPVREPVARLQRQ